jgi:methylenetetrahydrofolate--tRNA-(uracil-5-)-methyltransferase
MAGRMAAAERRGEQFAVPPATTAHGALINHITGGHIEPTDKGTGSFQPMNVNFGLFPPVDTPKRIEGKRLDHTEKAAARKRLSSRAKADFTAWLGGAVAIAAE